MATSIFFTESRDFKLIKDRILSQEEDYLVYVYADTTNIRIPRELITELPKYGNNLIWVDTAEMDASDLSHHMVLTIGQLMNPEEEIEFYIVSRSTKQEKTIHFLRNQGIPAELISGSNETRTGKAAGKSRRGRPKKAKAAKEEPGKTGRRGRPKKEKPAEEATGEVVKTGKRGRPRKEKVPPVEGEVTEAPAKKRGRPKATAVDSPDNQAEIAKPKKAKATAKKSRKKAAEPKTRKPRVEKEITEEMVGEKVAQYAVDDTNLSMVLTHLFSMKKVARPKFTAKLIDMVKMITLEDDTIAESILNRLSAMGIISENEGGRVIYKD